MSPQFLLLSLNRIFIFHVFLPRRSILRIFFSIFIHFSTRHISLCLFDCLLNDVAAYSVGHISLIYRWLGSFNPAEPWICLRTSGLFWSQWGRLSDIPSSRLGAFLSLRYQKAMWTLWLPLRHSQTSSTRRRTFSPNRRSRSVIPQIPTQWNSRFPKWKINFHCSFSIFFCFPHRRQNSNWPRDNFQKNIFICSRFALRWVNLFSRNFLRRQMSQ